MSNALGQQKIITMGSHKIAWAIDFFSLKIGLCGVKIALGVNEPTHNKKKPKHIYRSSNHFLPNSRFIFLLFDSSIEIDATQKKHSSRNTRAIGKNENVNLNGYGPSQYSEEKSYSTQRYESKIPLKLVMDPRGVVQDVHTTGITYDHSSGMLSPDKCAELVSALHTDAPKGKGLYIRWICFFSLFFLNELF